MSNYRWNIFEMFGESPVGQRFISAGGSKGGKSTTVSTPIWLPGQADYGPDYLANLKAIYEGDLSSPQAKMLQMLTKEAGMKEAAQERRRISSTPGLTAPAKAKSLGTLAGQTIGTMAGVPGKVWGYAADVLSKYMLTPPTMKTDSVTRPTRSFQGGICCYVVCAAGSTGQLLEYVRRYKDSHYDIDSMVAQGYKRFALWLVPLMLKHRTIKLLIKGVMVLPMELYSKAYYEDKHLLKWMLYPLTRFWVWTYALVGHFYGVRGWYPYWTLDKIWKKYHKEEL